MDRHDIVREIKRTAQENGGPPLGAKRFQDETGIKESDWFGKYWRNWGDALQEAGFRPNQLQTAYDETALTKALLDLIRELGRFPVKADLLLKRRRDASFPSHNVSPVLMTRRSLLTWYWLLAAWPMAALIVLIFYSIVRPPGNIPEPAATVVQWLWRSVLVVSVVSVVASPIALRRSAASADGATLSPRAALIALCASTAFQAFCEFVLFKPIE